MRLSGEGPIVGAWDRMRVDQIVSNLLSNALKSGEGKPVDVRVERQAGVARVSIHDAGDRHPSRAPGADLRTLRTRRPPAHLRGFGLGLWIVRQLLEALGGAIRLESEPGVGSTFTVELPLSPPAGGSPR